MSDDIEYGKIVQKGARFMWERKSLWVLGGLMSLGFTGICALGQLIRNVVLHNYVALILLVLFFFFKTFSWAGLIKTIAHDSVYRNKGLLTVLCSVWNSLGRLLILELVVSACVGIITVALLFQSVMLFENGNYFLGLISLSVSATLAVVVVAAMLFAKRFGFYYIILTNETILRSFFRGYRLVVSHIWQIIVIVFLLSIVMAGALVVVIFILAFIAIPCILIAFIGHGMILQVVSSGFIVLGLVLFLLFLAAMAAFFVFKEAVWYYFFQLIASEKKKDAIQEAKLIHDIPTAEPV